MNCKFQQPIKDFIIDILFVVSMFGIIGTVPAMLGMLLVYLEIGLDVFSANAVFESPYMFYQALGAYWIWIFILSVLLLVLGAKVLQGIYLLLFNRRYIKHWFKVNIYKCEGN